MSAGLRLLIVEDCEEDAALLIRELQRGGYDLLCERVETAEAMNTALDGQGWDLVISDYVMPCFSGLDALRLLQEKGLDLPFIIVSGNIGEDLAVESMKAGAHDYVLKDNLSRLVPAIKRELREAAIRQERRRAEKTVEQSEERFRSLFENAPMGIIIYRDNSIMFANQALLYMYGLKDASMIHTTSLVDYIAPDYRQEIRERIERRKLGKVLPKLLETVGLKQDGSTFPTFIETAQLDLPDGPACVSFISDITQSKMAEAALKRERVFSSAVLDTAGALVLVLDIEGRIVGFNRTCESVSGYSFKEVQGKAFCDLVLVPEEKERVRAVFKDLCSGKYPNNTENFWLTKKGDRRLIAWKNTVLLNDVRSVEYIVATGLDITEQRQAEDRLHLAAEVLENVSAGILVITVDGVVDSINPAFTSITGYSKSEVIGNDRSLLFFNHLGPTKSKELRRSLKETGQYRGKTWALRKDGVKYFEAYTITTIIDKKGQVTHYIRVFQDITANEKVRREKQRIQGQIAQMHKLSSLSALSAGVVHEIAQPLNSISVLADGMLYMLNRGKELGSEKIKEKLQSISEEIDRINAIIKHIRSFAQVGHAEMVPCSINKAVDDALDLLGSQLAAHGITIKKDFAANLADVMATRNDLEEVVINLLVNAMEALDDVSGNEKEIVIITCQLERKVIFEVADNAIGIDAGIGRRIFEPLYSTKNPDKSMGLGLSIVKSIVENLNGNIVVRNNEKGGATFRVLLPVL